MKKISVVFALFAALIFVVSCGGSSKNDEKTDSGDTIIDEDPADTEETVDTEVPDDADTTPGHGPDDDTDTVVEPSEAEECIAAGGTYNMSSEGGTCTKNVKCTDLPENAAWNGDPSYTMSYADGSWSEEIPAEFSEKAGECHFKCKEYYFYDPASGQCLNPCDSDPCGEVGCLATSASAYFCKCQEGYWLGSGKGCQETRPNIGNICTGQNKCYNSAKEIACPAEGEDFFGQDAYYASLGICIPQSFEVQTVSGQKVVVDRNTGLMWQQTIQAKKISWDAAVSYCNDLSDAGYSDWRLPAPKELLTIVDNSKNDPAIDETYFPDTPNSYFWSSTVYFANSGNAWGMDASGKFEFFEKGGAHYVRCVRGDAMPNSSFETESASDEVVVKDLSTGLLWQKTIVGDKTWQEALDYCENLTYAGHSDWRLPNRNELVSLANYEKYQPASDFPDMQRQKFWSSFTFSGDVVLSVDFDDGYTGSANKSDSSDIYVRCVK